MARIHRILAAGLLAAGTLAAPAQAQGPASPVGLWRTVDDVKPGKYKVLIRIAESAGVYSGRVEKVLDPELVGKACTRCSGALANQPFEGLPVLTDMRLEADGYGGGQIVDPEGGGVYRCKMQPAGDGKTMRVRGFIGIALLGRTQVWERVDP